MRLSRKVYADEELDDQVIDDAGAEVDDGGEGDVEVAPEATDLLFEAEDVAELVAEITGEAVDVAVDTDSVVFTVGDTDYTVEPEGDEEVLESSRRVLRGKRNVAASTHRNTPAKKPVKSNTQPARRPAAPAKTPVKSNTRVFRKVPSNQK